MPSVREEIDSYVDTVWGLLALHNELTWDDATRSRLPATAFVARHTEVVTLTGGQPITPDIHIQLADGLPIGDVKMSFAGGADDPQRLADIEAQLRKYDAALPEIAAGAGVKADECCVVLLVHNSRAYSARRFAEALEPLKHKLAVLSYSRTDQAQTFITLELRHGTLVPKKKHEKLAHNPLQIRVDHLTRGWPDILFYDSEPPDVYVAEVFWTSVLGELARRAMKPADTGLPRVVRVNLPSTAKLLSDGYSIKRICKNARQCPSTTQIRRVFQLLARMDLAVEVGVDSYDVTRLELPDVRAAFEKRLEKADAKDASRAARAAMKEQRRRERDEAKRAAKDDRKQLGLFESGS